ncbi:alpha/beta-hydrolase N-terminal domain-containing protein, partial [Nocardia abscessus]|uniref:alpha/beta-hydrolase N-terminal domain-containing protein n=1 Tax=Nocardia abscessus TaxID=120957 RepID=UPI002453AF03
MTSSVPELLDRRPWLAAAIGRVVPPRIGTTLGIGTGVLASLAPGLLPRTPGAQAVLTGLLAALTLGVAGGLRVLLRRCAFDIGQGGPGGQADQRTASHEGAVGGARGHEAERRH